MVEIRITVTDPALVHALMLRLRRLFAPPDVTYDAASKQVRVCSEWESRAVVEVVDAVQRWVDEGDTGSAELAVGDRHYTLVGPTLDETRSRPTVRK
jgi:hypothetical protein